MSFRDAIYQDESSQQSSTQKEFHPIRDLIDNIRANRERRHEARLSRRQDRNSHDSDSPVQHNPYDRHAQPDRIAANEYPRNMPSYDNYPPRRNVPPQYYPPRPEQNRPRTDLTPPAVPPIRFSTQEPPLADEKKAVSNYPGNGAGTEPQRLPAGFDLSGFPKIEPPADNEPVADDTLITERTVPEPIYITERNGDRMSIADSKSVSADDRLSVYLRERGNLLTELDVNGAGISDKSLSLLSQAPNLNKLALNDTSSDDNSMNVLAKQGLKNLQELNLHSTRVGDAGVAQLKDMPIKKLNLSDTIVSDDCIKQLKNMRSLQVLTLDYSDIRNEGAKSFKEMPNLRSLSLKGCPITDDAVMDLSKCQQLMVLNLEDTKLSADKVAFLQKNMPKCVIIPPDGTGNASEGLSNHRQHQHPQERRPGIFRLPSFRRERDR